VISPRRVLEQTGFDDDRCGVGQHVHQRLVAGGQRLVGGETSGAERAVQGAVAEGDRDGDEAADPRHPVGGQLHRRREVADVGHHRRQRAVADRLAEGGLLRLGDAVFEQQRQRRFHYLQVLGGAVHPGQESQAQPQRAPSRPQQVGDLQLGVRPLTCHALFTQGVALSGICSLQTSARRIAQLQFRLACGTGIDVVPVHCGWGMPVLPEPPSLSSAAGVVPHLRSAHGARSLHRRFGRLGRYYSWCTVVVPVVASQVMAPCWKVFCRPPVVGCSSLVGRASGEPGPP